MTDRPTQYALDVTEGRIVAGPHVRDACARHLRDLKRTDGVVYWDVEAAERAMSFFPDVLRVDCTVTDDGGQETKPFDLLDWQAFIIGSLFGWKRCSDGYRRFLIAFIETGKGTGKTPLAAGTGLYMEIADGESRAEVYAAATKKDQAKVLFRDAVHMVEQSPELQSLLHLSGRSEITNIAFLEKGSFFVPISSEERGKGQSGPRPHCALLDEIHEHGSNAMVEFMRAGTKGRRQALIFMITNSGSNRNSVCYEYHDYAAKVCAGSLEDDSFFGYVCALDPEVKDGDVVIREADDPFNDESCWIKANPSLGHIFDRRYLREQVTQAKGMPSKQNIVRRLNFCQWTESVEAWITKQQWDRNSGEVDRDALLGRRCWGGLDLSGGKNDLTSLELIFEGGEVISYFWMAGDGLKERAERDRAPYDVWRDAGYLIAKDGATIDYADIALVLEEVDRDFDLQVIGFDRYRIDDLRRELDGSPVVLVEHGQGFKDMNLAIEAIEDELLNGRLIHGNNPVLTSCVANAVVTRDPTNARKFAKDKATGRIDGAVALAMAQRMRQMEKESMATSPWDDPDYTIAAGA